MSENIKYLDREKLKIKFSTLIIKVDSINRLFGTLAEFAKETNLHGVTNGKIHLMAEMMEPPYSLYNLADEHLIPLGFEENRDYVFVQEQPITGPDGFESDFLNQPLAELRNIDWLDSFFSPEGNFVWFKEKVGRRREETKAHTKNPFPV